MIKELFSSTMEINRPFVLLENLPLGIFVLQRDMEVVYWNPCLENWTGIPREQIVGTQIGQTYPHLNNPKFIQYLQGIFEGGLPITFFSEIHKHLIPCPLPDGNLRIQHTTVISIEAREEETSYLALFAIQDYTDILSHLQNHQNLQDLLQREKDAQSQTAEQLRLATRFCQNSNEAMVITDRQGTILDVNNAFCRITGYSREEVLGKTNRILKSGRHDETFYQEMWRAVTEAGQWQGEIWDRHKDGNIYLKWITISGILDEEGQTTHYMGISTDLTGIKQTEERLQQIVHHDALTGLANRVLLRDRLKQAIHFAHRYRQCVGVLIMDLDGFKTVNDTLGHSLGDMLLMEAARRISSCVRSSDTVARLGGDEFTVVLPEVGAAENVAVVAQKIITAIAEPFFLEGHEIYLTTSVGISTYPQEGDTCESLMKHADSAMYYAKERGKNNYQFFRKDMSGNISEKLEIGTKLRRSIVNNELFLHYQPRVDLRSGRIVGLEALIRWKHTKDGLIMPARFIPVAEETGMIVPIGEWVLREVCRQNIQWERSEMGPLRISVNLSARQFHHHDIQGTVEGVLQETGMSPKLLELEITESILMYNVDEAIQTMRRLKQMGISLSIDDFGIGYSSLNYLKRFPIDVLKIDRSFIIDLTRNSEDEAVVNTIIALAKNLKLKVVAEGVETESQIDFLLRTSCDEIQGFFFSKPLSPDELEIFLAAYSDYPPFTLLRKKLHLGATESKKDFP